MQSLMFLFIVDIVVGYHLVKGREAPGSIHICPVLNWPKLDLVLFSHRELPVTGLFL